METLTATVELLLDVFYFFLIVCSISVGIWVFVVVTELIKTIVGHFHNDDERYL